MLKIYQKVKSEEEIWNKIADIYLESTSICMQVSLTSAECSILNNAEEQKTEVEEEVSRINTVCTFNSVFREKFGTPRQSWFTKLSRGRIRITNSYNVCFFYLAYRVLKSAHTIGFSLFSTKTWILLSIKIQNKVR